MCLLFRWYGGYFFVFSVPLRIASFGLFGSLELDCVRRNHVISKSRNYINVTIEE